AEAPHAGTSRGGLTALGGAKDDDRFNRRDVPDLASVARLERQGETSMPESPATGIRSFEHPPPAGHHPNQVASSQQIRPDSRVRVRIGRISHCISHFGPPAFSRTPFPGTVAHVPHLR